MSLISDNFNRPNTQPGDLGPNWQVANFATLQIRSQRVEGRGQALFTAFQTDGPNVTIAALFRLHQSVPMLRRAAVLARGGEIANVPDPTTAYLLGFEIINTTLEFVIWKRNAGVLLELARSATTYLIPVGSDIAVRAIVEGNGLKIINANNGTTLVQASDSDFTGPGYHGLDLGVDGSAENLSADNWFAQDLSGPIPPDRPILTVTEVTTTGVCLRGTAFHDRNLDSHVSTRWQIAEERYAFGGPLLFDVTINTGDSPADIELLDKCFTGLLSGTRYCARVAYIDSDAMVSDWSPIVCFTTKPAVAAVNRKLYSQETHELTCEEAPTDFWRYTLFIQEQLQQVGVMQIEGPGGLYQYGDVIPFCVIDDMNTKMLEIRANWGLIVSGCASGRIEIPFDINTPRPITVEHDCGKIPIVQVVELDPNLPYPYAYPGPYGLVDEVYGGFAGEHPAQNLWVQHIDNNAFRIHTTAARGVVIAIFR